MGIVSQTMHGKSTDSLLIDMDEKHRFSVITGGAEVEQAVWMQIERPTDRP